MKFAATVLRTELLEKDRYKIVFEDEELFAHGMYEFTTTCSTAQEESELNSLRQGDKIQILFVLYK